MITLIKKEKERVCIPWQEPNAVCAGRCTDVSSPLRCLLAFLCNQMLLATISIHPITG